MKMSEHLELWTADEVAECLPGIGNDLYDKLWGILGDAKSPTPLGGDGTNGTVEYPCGRQNPENDDKAPHWWNKLTEQEQAIINKAIESEMGKF